MTATLVTLVLMLNAAGSDSKSALTTIPGFSSVEACEAAAKPYDTTMWGQYHYCIEVK